MLRAGLPHVVLIAVFFLTIAGRQVNAQVNESQDQKPASSTNSIESLDKDNNGLISLKEAVANPELLAVFGKVDKNHDGNIDSQELTAARISNLLTP